MYIVGKCKECKGRPIFDIGDSSKEEVRELMKKNDFGHCAVGFHVELGKMADYYELDWNQTFETEEDAKEFLRGEKF